MNIWRRGLINKNPYYRNAFRVTRVPTELTRRRSVVQVIGSTKRIVATDKQAHQINGEPVTESELNVAEQIILDPEQRIIEELLEHTTEKTDSDAIKRYIKKVESKLQAGVPENPELTNLKGLLPLLDQIAAQLLNESPYADPSFGASELTLIPPFGLPQE